MNLSSDQKKSLETLCVWVQSEKKKRPYITLGGFAGTGKTTLVSKLRNKLSTPLPKLKVAFASYTGKATRVLQLKLEIEKTLMKQDTIGTIHSLIYTPVVDDGHRIIGWKKKDALDYDLIIIDEGSMIDRTIWHDLLSYSIPIIVVGDHGQLPPIRGNFYLMQKPDITIETIHRQARENPIIGLSIQAREQGYIRHGEYSQRVKKHSLAYLEGRELMNELVFAHDQNTYILCGYNHTRKKLNNLIRISMGMESQEPLVGDRVICLRNNHEKNIFNGMMGTVMNIEEHNEDWYYAEIEMDYEENRYEGLISSKQFQSDTSLNYTDERRNIMQGDLFDFGYAMTVHKAQGSEAKRVILFEERFKKMNDEQWKRWLYTAVTRAEEELYIFG